MESLDIPPQCKGCQFMVLAQESMASLRKERKTLQDLGQAVMGLDNGDYELFPDRTDVGLTEQAEELLSELVRQESEPGFESIEEDEQQIQTAIQALTENCDGVDWDETDKCNSPLLSDNI